MRMLYAVVLGLTALACASVQPARVEVGDRCLRCRRPVTDVRMAGEIIDSMRAPFPFRSPACLAKYVKDNRGTAFTAIFVTDYKSGRMIPVSDAWFVPTTMTAPDGRTAEPDYFAFRSRGDAEAYKADTASFKRWAQIVAEAE